MQEYVTLKEIAEKIGLDRSNVRKWVLSNGFSFVKIRDNETRQLVNALTIEDAERAIELRLHNGFTLSNSKETAQVIDNNAGFFYVVVLMPDLAPNRIKIGFANSIQSRLSAHRTTCPQLELIKSWPCQRNFEAAAIAAAINDDCMLYGGEVYDTQSIEKVVNRLDSFFYMVRSK